MRRFLFSLIVLAACGDDGPAAQAPVEPPAPVADAAVADSASPAPAPKAIPLVDWVDDLVDRHTDDTSAPDTVDDKNIADDEDPSHFQSRF